MSEESQAEVLVVDDEDVVLRTLLIILRRAGFAAEGVSTGSAALHFIDKHFPRVVLVDLHLPDVNGMLVAAHSAKKLPHAKTFVMTGDPDAWLIPPENETLAAVEVLAKPVRPDELLSRIQEALTGA